jgi:SAM-dependent methyltransferase
VSSSGIDTKSWTDIPTLPYQDSSVELILSHFVPVLLRSSQWPGFVLECARVLRPGGIFEVTILDPMPRNCGPLLRQWTAEKIVLGLERRFLVTHPAMIIPVWLNDVTEFGHRDSHTLSFSAVLEETYERSLSQSAEVHYPSTSAYESERYLQELRIEVGRYFYEVFYGGLILSKSSQLRSSNPDRKSAQEPLHCRWWWADSEIVKRMPGSRDCLRNRNLQMSKEKGWPGA